MGGAPPTTEVLDPQFVQRIVATLFPDEGGVTAALAPEDNTGREWNKEELGVTQGEVKDAVGRIKSGKAPGPDGIHRKVWALAFKELGAYMRHLFNRCLREGRFPAEWKGANLVLIPKKGTPGDQPSAYRPICLLDAAGKNS